MRASGERGVRGRGVVGADDARCVDAGAVWVREGRGVEEGYACGGVVGAVGEGEGGGDLIEIVRVKTALFWWAQCGRGMDLRPKTPDPTMRMVGGGDADPFVAAMVRRGGLLLSAFKSIRERNTDDKRSICILPYLISTASAEAGLASILHACAGHPSAN